MPEFQVDWFSHNIDVFKMCLNQYKDKPVNFLEIGSFEGRSALWLLENILTHPDSRITCIDPLTGSAEHTAGMVEKLEETFKKNVLDSEYGHKVTLIQKMSKDALLMPEIRSQQFDFIYIDGDHHAYSALSDAVLSFDLLKEGGYIIFDDLLWGSQEDLGSYKTPLCGIQGFVTSYSPFIDVISQGYQLAIRKKKVSEKS